LFVTSPLEARSQSAARVLTEENFRREPNGVVLARLSPGTPLSVVARSENWLQVDVEGWVWLNSLRTSDTEFDLVVSVADGENLRDGPSGNILGRLGEGVLLEELDRQPAWIQVRRRGWIWSASVDEATSGLGGASADVQALGPAARRPAGFVSVGDRGGPILTSPDWDTLAVAAPRSDVEVLAREGNWARVRLEGWMWMPAAEPPGGVGVDAPTALLPEDLIGDPDRYVGRAVLWDLQFISLQRAETIRTDFFEGEPFLLARFGGPDGPFVYVAVPPERLAEVEGLIPLERISVTARIRTGASTLTGTPIVDLLGLEKTR